MRQVRRIALLVESSRNYGRGLLRGISSYVREHGYWSFFFQPHGLEDGAPVWLGRWEGDGIIARVNDEQMAEVLSAVRVPVVDLRNSVTTAGFPGIGPDNRLVARLAADHFLERGFRQFGFCGMPRGVYRYMDQRRDSFVEILAEAGYVCSAFELSANPRGARGWDNAQDRLARWIARLPKPVAVMACNDDHGIRVLDACQRAEVSVPEEAAVLGVDDDQTLCTLSAPPLSSVNLDVEGIGYAAAELLDRLMGGERPPEKTIELPPRGVVTRQSTDILATDDNEVAMALRFIRERACDGIRVGDVVRHVLISRSSLERRFKAVLGRTPSLEIQRIQMDRAKQLLSETTLSLETVARRSGFGSRNYFSEVFHKSIGLTPGQYRRKYSER
ncbi:MAG TPA: XylR family transcriptional regulator [Planctomycetaceae bacterium]|nr:XylR family transcriptional regulator [Planctomycetaceae bacterium]